MAIDTGRSEADIAQMTDKPELVSVAEFAAGCLKEPVLGCPRMIVEYQEAPLQVKIHNVTFTCSGKVGKRSYWGGLEDGEFKVFESSRILRMVQV